MPMIAITQQQLLKDLKNKSALNWPDIAIISGLKIGALKAYGRPENAKYFKVMPDIDRLALELLYHQVILINSDDEILNIDEYPEMSLIAWNRAVRTISADDAFSLYESNWRFVDVDNITSKEFDLIERLTKKFGKGILNV